MRAKTFGKSLHVTRSLAEAGRLLRNVTMHTYTGILYMHVWVAVNYTMHTHESPVDNHTNSGTKVASRAPYIYVDDPP